MEIGNFVKLTPEDLPDVMALQARMVEALPDPRWYYTSTPEMFAADLRVGGMLGCWHDGRLIAMGNAYPYPEGSVNYAGNVGDEPEHSFCFVDVMVDREFRRMGLHSRLLELYRQRAEELACRAIYATVDPDNVPSRSSFEKAGYVAMVTQPAYDGRPRVYYRLLLPLNQGAQPSEE